MNDHKHARLTPTGRRLMVRRLAAGESVARMASGLGLSTTSVRRWWKHYQAEGSAGLENRSSRPHHSPRQLPRARWAGSALWTPDLSRHGQVLRYPGRALRTDVIYHHGLKRYLMAMALDGRGGWTIFDAPEPWGPWTTAFFTPRWDLG